MQSISQIAGDIYQVRLPLPFALRLVNCYLLRGPDGWTVVDTGLHTEQGEAAGREVLAALGIAAGDLRQIVVTHHHPDHYGMAGWLSEWNSAPLVLYTSQRELGMIEQVWQRPRGQQDEFAQLMRCAGVACEMLDDMMQVTAEIRGRTAPHPPRFECVGHGDALTLGARRFEVLLAAGHSVAQVMLYDPADRLLLCADHVLMTITPNVGIWPGSDADPLARFVESLRQLATLPVRLALPGHRAVITDWPGRLAELLHHHDERLALIGRAAGDGAQVLEIAQRVFDFRHFTAHEMRFAVAETLAHLEYLRAQALVTRTDDLPWVYRRVPV